MLRRLELTNFKNHASTVMDGLDDGNGRGCVHVLVGPNGAGKSSVLEALNCLHHMGRLSGDDVFVGRVAPPLVIQSGQSRTDLRGVRAPGVLTVNITNADDGLTGSRAWRLTGDERPGEAFSRWHDAPSPNARTRELLAAFSYVRHLHLRSERIATPSRSTAEVPAIDADGYGTATVLADMLASSPDQASGVNGIVRAVVPAVHRVFARRRKVTVTDHLSVTVGETAVPVPQSREEVGHELAFETASGTVGAEQASEGTLLVTALAVAMCAESRPPLILLDDVETGLHPTAQIELMRHLKAIATAEGGPQIFVTTHSPFVLDGVEPDHVWVVAADAKGIAHVRRLSEHPRVEEAAALLETGELWTTFGDAWAAEPSEGE